MHVYVIGASPEGPCKIGCGNSKRRLKSLQTGSPFRLQLLHEEPIGNAARFVERTVHDALKDKKCGGGKEWFAVTLDEARMQIGTAAAAAGVLLDDARTLYDIQEASMLRWFAEERRRKENWDEDIDGPYEELEGGAPPSPLAVIAETRKAPAIRQFGFGNYLLTHEEGIRLRWAFEQLSRPMPIKRALQSYKKADDFLESQQFKSGRRLNERWIEWSLGRELNGDEAFFLGRIWDEFAVAHNNAECDSKWHLLHGNGDHVDDVHVAILCDEEGHSEPQRLMFSHRDFRAILFPSRRTELSVLGRHYVRILRPIEGHRDLRGFVTPIIPRNIWNAPFLPWLRNAERSRDVSLDAFLANPKRKLPVVKDEEDVGALALVHVQLPEYGPGEYT